MTFIQLQPIPYLPRNLTVIQNKYTTDLIQLEDNEYRL